MILSNEISNIIIPFSAVDDVFVRKDLLKSKYDFVDFASVEKHPNWCTHYSECECGKPSDSGNDRLDFS